MGTHGYMFADHSTLREVDWSDVERDVMMATYKADIGCQISTNFIDTAGAVDARVGKEVLDESNGAIEGLRRLANEVGLLDVPS